MTPDRLLLCTDLDRTLLPNGPEPESPRARKLFCALAARPEVTLAYVTGRDRDRVERAIQQYELPVPDHVIADVGTTIYEITASDTWARNREWEEQIGRDWKDNTHDSIARHLDDLDAMRLQEPSRQGHFKLSYYVSRDVDAQALTRKVSGRLEEIGIRHSAIFSVDDLRGVGLLDILPAEATKLHAIEFVMRKSGFTESSTVFCGDSGNDLSVLASRIPGVLVANASDEVRRDAIELARQCHNEHALYIARGSFLDLNGNFAGGILEGVAHYFPAALQWLDATRPEAFQA